MIVNTATGCGFTPQYEALERLYRKYKSAGFEILDFPCDQFGHQAPGDDSEIHEFCTLKYKTSFIRFKKIEVNGENASPVWKFLKENSPEEYTDENPGIAERFDIMSIPTVLFFENGQLKSRETGLKSKEEIKTMF